MLFRSVAGAGRFGDAALADAALGAARFIDRHTDTTGACPLIVYADGRVRRHPQWVAATGDILRGLLATHALGGPPPSAAMQARLFAGQDGNGGVRTARGFAATLGDPVDASLPELRDLLHVAGWADKAFRYLADTAEPPSSPSMFDGSPFEAFCTFRRRRLRYLESGDGLTLEHSGRTIYRWRKERDWAWIGASWLDLR